MTLSAAWATALAVGDTAWAAAWGSVRNPAVSPAPAPAPPDASYSDSAFEFDVFVRASQDVVAIRVTVTNLGPAVDDFDLSYVDNKTGRESRHHTMSLGPGERRFMDLFGGLDRTFNTKVCRGSSGNCVVVGPVTTSSQ